MKNILFVCIENSCRSQMAEAFANRHIKKQSLNNIKAHSAGSRPSGQVNLRAIEFMQEIDYDLNTHHSNSLDDIPDINYDHVITMGCGDECPFIKATQREDWGIQDPKHLSADEFRQTRDLIETKVKELLQKL